MTVRSGWRRRRRPCVAARIWRRDARRRRRPRPRRLGMLSRPIRFLFSGLAGGEVPAAPPPRTRPSCRGFSRRPTWSTSAIGGVSLWLFYLPGQSVQEGTLHSGVLYPRPSRSGRRPSQPQTSHHGVQSGPHETGVARRPSSAHRAADGQPSRIAAPHHGLQTAAPPADRRGARLPRWRGPRPRPPPPLTFTATAIAASGRVGCGGTRAGAAALLLGRVTRPAAVDAAGSRADRHRTGTFHLVSPPSPALFPQRGCRRPSRPPSSSPTS